MIVMSVPSVWLLFIVKLSIFYAFRKAAALAAGERQASSVAVLLAGSRLSRFPAGKVLPKLARKYLCDVMRSIIEQHGFLRSLLHFSALKLIEIFTKHKVSGICSPDYELLIYLITLV